MRRAFLSIIILGIVHSGFCQLYESNKLYVSIISEESIPFIENDSTYLFESQVLTEIFNDYNLTGFEKTFSGEPDETLDLSYTITCDCDEKKLKDTLLNFASEYYSEISLIPEYFPTYTPNDFGSSGGHTTSNQTDLQLINAELAWDITKGSSEVKIAIIETPRGGGFDPNHEDLQGKLHYIHPSVNNFTNREHGTNVAGVAAAATDNNIGISSIGFNSSLLLYNSTNPNNIKDAVDRGAKIINCSYGHYLPDNNTILAINYAVSKGAIVVAGAGNGPCWERLMCPSNGNEDCIPCSIPAPCTGASGATLGSGTCEIYPASYDNVISVTSVGHINELNQGALSDIKDVHLSSPADPESGHNHNSKIDLCAPGYNITTTFPDDSYGSNWGTSFASPMVAGTAALLFSVNPCLTPEKISEILKSTAVNIDNIPENQPFAGLLGSGRVDAHAAVLAAQQYGQHPSITSNPNYFNNEYYVKDELVVEPSAHLIVTGTIRFAQGAKLIVKQGAKLTVDGGTLTNSIGCNNEFWEGIEVWGYNWANQTSVQGQVELKNGAVIENAKNGIRAGEPGNNNSGGGILNINNATFKNCQRGIEFMFYNAEESQSRIVNSDFIIDDDYIQTSYNYRPYSQISMSNIKGVEIRVNDFINQNSEFQNSNPVYYWGTGIKSIDAEYINTNNNFEGFYYGVDLNGILTLPSTEIKSNTFKSCHRGVFVRNGHFTRINTNTFEDCVAAGAHVWSSNGFELHHNTFLENNSAPLGSPAVSRGLYLDRLGNYGNGFYNNTFPDNNMASSTFGNNRGLSFDCNDFSESNLFDFMAMRNAGYSGNLLSNLGSPVEPLANFFSTPCPGYGSHLNLASNHPDVNYYHYDASSEPRVEPTCVSNRFNSVNTLIDLNEDYCTTPGSPLDPKQVIGQVGIGSESDDRLSVLSSGLSGKKGVIDDLQVSIHSIIDDGETQYQLSLINDETVSSSTLATTLSGDVAPFVSTEVLNASIYRDPAMHSTDLLAVLLANSPLPWEIQMDSAGIYEKLNDQDHYDSLWSYQNGISPVDSLYNSLINHENELERILSKMVITLLTDTFIVDGGRDAFDYMITYTDAEEMLMPKLRLAWQEGLESEADSILNVMGDVDEYEDIVEILNDMNAGFGEFENPMLLYTESQTFNNKVHSLAADTLKFGYEIARDIITQFEDTTFFYPLMNPEIDPAGKKAGEEHKQERIENEKKVQYPKIGSSIRLYPNPTRNEIRIAGDQSEQFKDYRILSIDGRLVKSGRLNNEKVIQAGELSPGLYVVVLLHDEGSITRKIVIE